MREHRTIGELSREEVDMLCSYHSHHIDASPEAENYHKERIEYFRKIKAGAFSAEEIT
jgi:hypothetical protein